MKIAIVADWLTNQGGAEKVIYDIHLAFPNAPIYTTIFNQSKLPQFANANIKTSFLQKLPLSKKLYQLYLPFMPTAFQSFDLTDYDLVISSSFACAKHLILKPETYHLCYCHNPMRYLYDQSHQYLKEHNFPNWLKLLSYPILHQLRMNDQQQAPKPNLYLANSQFVAQRIQKYYKRPATTLHPATDLQVPVHKIQSQKQNYYLAVGRLKPFKRFDLIVETFNLSQKSLLIVGTGEDESRLQKLNTNPNTRFLGFQSQRALQQLFLQAKALIFPQSEDFGITPVEANLHGCPVIAFNHGGATETIIPQKTGIFFSEQTPTSLQAAINTLEQTSFNYLKIHQHATQFNRQHFIKSLTATVQNLKDQCST